MVAASLAATATGLAAVFLIPQIGRLVTRGDASGVSPVWAAFGVITNASWVAYLGMMGLWPAVAAPALAVVTYGVMLVVLVPIDRGSGWFRTSLGYAVVLAAIGPLAGLGMLGLALSITPAVQLAPQVIGVFREECPSGVSPTTWSLAIAEAVLWGCYGWLMRDAALVGYGLVTSVASVLILGRWMVTRPLWRTPAAAPAAAG
jgi:uncharacterized protein with PQ loop repeat